MKESPPNTVCRPPRIREMLASRACRKSVMIGTTLSRFNMRQLIDQMGQIEHPWVSFICFLLFLLFLFS